jgi:raffinose/stachyose/melibiose transport system substrate-binding protein
MISKRRVGIAASLTAIALSLTACISGNTAAPTKSNGAPGASKPTGSIEVVSFYPVGSPDYKRLQDRATAFEAKYPGTKVNFVFGGGQNTPKIQARWRAGNPPEVSYGFFDGTTSPGLKYAQAGQVQALDAWLDQPLAGYSSTWRAALLPSVKPLITMPSDGKTYAVPESISTIQMYYNKKIFTDHGLTPPKTYDEMIASADKLKAAGIAPFAVTGTTNAYMQFWYDYLLLRRTGAANVEAAIAGSKDFASVPGVREAASDLEKLVKGGYFINSFKSTDFTAAQLNFFQGKSAMILMGSWMVGEMKDSIPSGFQIGTFPFPSVSSGVGDQGTIFGSSNTMSVAAASKNPATGVAWLQFLAQEENQTSFVTSTGQISAYNGVAAPAGFESVLAGLKRPNAFVPSYFGVIGAGTKITDAYELPIAELFFGKKDAAGMVAAIDSNLRTATSG